jgi:translation initiation factor eIF-2B subunit beta
LVAITGTQPVVTAAHYHSTPVVVCTGLYKLSQKYPYDTDEFHMPVNPDAVMSFKDGVMTGSVDVLNSYFDFVDPKFLKMFITNVGPNPPSYIYHLMKENYSRHDRQ